jgi:hypothetical protein
MLPFYNVTVSLSRTNFDTQSQEVVFEVSGVMYPVDMGQNLVLPLGPGSSEYPTIMTLYDIVIDGRNEHPDMVTPIVGDELAVAALNSAASAFNGRWRLIAAPQVWNGGEDFNELNSEVLRVVQIA